MVALLLATITGCGRNGRSNAAPDTTSPPLPVDFSKPGPYRVGTLRVPLGDREAVVYYPADGAEAQKAERVEGYRSGVAFPEPLRPNLPPELDHAVRVESFASPKASNEGPFPVVFHSHDYGGYHLFTSRHGAHLASWGFVFSATDHKEQSLTALVLGPVASGRAGSRPDQDLLDLKATLLELQRINVDPDHPLHGSLDLDHVGVEGYGSGWRAARDFAADPAVKAYIGLAPMPPVSPESLQNQALAETARQALQREELAAVSPPVKPSLLIVGDRDTASTGPLVEAVYRWLRPPKSLVVMRGAGHGSFSDLCVPIRERGGHGHLVLQLPAIATPLVLSQNGCTNGDLDPIRGYALMNQLAIAHLRWSFGVDSTRTSLDPEFIRRTFGDALAGYEVTP
jgi:predicted dienelactone hydrolase